jgi:hypothetical protein
MSFMSFEAGDKVRLNKYEMCETHGVSNTNHYFRTNNLTERSVGVVEGESKAVGHIVVNFSPTVKSKLPIRFFTLAEPKGHPLTKLFK